MSKLWDTTARIYPWFRSNPVSGYFLRKEIEACANLLSFIAITQHAHTADIGAGRGHSLTLLPDSAGCKIAVDNSKKMISLTYSAFSEIQFIQADTLNLPFKEQTFELIICVGLLEYIPDLDRLLTELSTILKTNGYLLLTSTPKRLINFFRFFHGHKLYYRSVEKVRYTMAAHPFKIVRINTGLTQDQFLLYKEYHK